MRKQEHHRGNQAAEVCFEALSLSWVEPIPSDEDEVLHRAHDEIRTRESCTLPTKLMVLPADQRLYVRLIASMYT